MVKADPETRLADAAFRVLARTRWTELTLAAVAKSARMPLKSLYPVSPNKTALLPLMLRRIGRETSAQYRPDRQSASPRERLFDVAMTWFEVLEDRKTAMRSLYEGLRRDPFALAALRASALAETQWLLTLAEADAGSASPFRAIMVLGILLRAMPPWLDDGPDMSKTMTRLDGDLRRAERLLWPVRGAARKSAVKAAGE